MPGPSLPRLVVARAPALLVQDVPVAGRAPLEPGCGAAQGTWQSQGARAKCTTVSVTPADPAESPAQGTPTSDLAPPAASEPRQQRPTTDGHDGLKPDNVNSSVSGCLPTSAMSDALFRLLIFLA